MKRFLAIVLVLILAGLVVVPLSAEETTTAPQTTENATTETNAPTGENNAPTDEPADDAPSWGNTVTTTEFFDTVIMPILIGLGSAVTISFGVILYLLKVWGRLKDAVAKVKELMTSKKATDEEIEYLKGILEKIDVNNISLELNECVEKAQSSLKLDEATISELVGTVAVLKSMMENFMKAAENAWSASPAAVSLLTSAESTALKSMSAKITAFEKYIRAEKGAEAEGIIRDIEGV